MHADVFSKQQQIVTKDTLLVLLARNALVWKESIPLETEMIIISFFW